MIKIDRIKIVVLFLVAFSINAYSQENMTVSELAGQMNVITSAVPFLRIAPESRGGAMGDIGIATSPDVNSMHWNPAKYAFIDTKMGVSISYTPWLRKLVGDIDLAYLAFYKKIDNSQAFAASLRYFSLGNISFTNNSGQFIQDFTPNEFAIDGAYSLKLGDRFSGGIALRYIYSNLTGGVSVNSSETHPGNTAAADISFFYTNNDIRIAKKSAVFSFGTNISNIGAKISYTDDSEKNFIPTNLGLGTSLKLDLDDYNSIMVALDFNKFLIPTPPVYDEKDRKKVNFGLSDDVSVAKGIFQSFNDAPGKGKEELHEVTYSFGMEYWYAKQFAIRTGYFHEHETKGNRKYFAAGIGLRLNVFGLDFSYLVPINQRNPLEDTIRFTLTFNFDSFNKKDDEE